NARPKQELTGAITRCDHPGKLGRMSGSLPGAAVEVRGKVWPRRQTAILQAVCETRQSGTGAPTDLLCTLIEEGVSRTYTTIIMGGHDGPPIPEAGLQHPQVLHVVDVDDVRLLPAQHLAHACLSACICRKVRLPDLRHRGCILPQRRVTRS